MGKVAKVSRLVVILAVERKLHFAQRRVHQLQGGHHVDVPVEKEVDLRRAAAGGGAHRGQPRNGVNAVLDRLGDADLHLLNGGYAVVHADDDAGKIGLGEDGYGDFCRHENAGDSEHDGEKKDGARGAGEPETVLLCGPGGSELAHSSLPPAAGFLSSASPPLSSSPAGPILTLVPSSSP